ncbi:MAG TPA: alpha/beta hydrolase-fold protein [Bryobacteraceae bacterium]|nr:alpha/beta hydrolase-fold protein [Bryobacteraceae bacterium]
MKVRFAIFSLLVCLIPSVQAQRPAGARPPATVRSPEVAPDRTVTFRLRAPAATEVTLTGEFMKGSKPLQKDADGVWSVTVGPLAPEIYNYNFTIDGVRSIDPGNPNVKTGSTASTIASILEVPGAGPAFYDAHRVPHGEIRTHWYESKSLKMTRRLTVYTPPGYDRNRSTRYPVLYLLHGANADERAWTTLGRVNLILDNLLADSKIKPFVVVMPFGYGTPPGTPRAIRPSPLQYTVIDGGGRDQSVENRRASRPSTGFTDVVTEFSSDLLGDVIPFIDANYRVYSDRDHRAIAGLSMGGLESLEIGLNHLELFSYVAGFSAAVRPPEFQKAFASLTADPQSSNRKLHLLWIGCGTDDSLFPSSQAFTKFLEEAKVKYKFYSVPGAHTWIVWRQFLKEVAPQLF